MSDLPNVLVMPHARVLSLGKGETKDPQLFPLLTFQQAFLKPHATDAHFVCYYPTDDSDSFPRLNKSRDCLDLLRQNQATFGMHWFALDIDLPGHARWSDKERFAQSAWFSDQLQKIQSLPEGRQAGIYQTRGGYRLLWPLLRPIQPAAWETLARDMIARFHAVGVPCDNLHDWTRLFRLPLACRDGEVVNRFADFEDMAPLEYKPGLQIVDAFQGIQLPAKLKRALERGDQLAEHGERHNIILSTLGTLLRTMVPIDPDRAVKLMARSIATQVAAGSTHTLDRVAKMAVDVAAKEQEARRIRGETASTAVPDPLLQNIAESVAEMPLAPFLQTPKGESVWVWSEQTNGFVGPYARQTMLAAFEQHSPVGSKAITRDALNNARKADQLLLESGRIFGSVRYELGRDRAIYAPTMDCLLERAGEFRTDLTPQFNAQVDRWLRSFAPGQEDHWLSWLATVRWSNRPTCAYYLHTAPGAGKQLLVAGIGNLWKRRTHTTWQVAISRFNAAIKDAPLIVADEEMAVEKDKSPTAVLRELVANTQHQMQVKFADEVFCSGSLRVLMTANNANLIKTEKEALSQDDLQAVIDRISYVYSGNAPVQIMREVAGWETTNQWLEQDVITRHLLALEASIAPWQFGKRFEDALLPDCGFKAGPRFLVHGQGTRYHQNLINRSGVTRQTLTALCYLLVRIKGGAVISKVRTRQGQFVVNATAFYDRWRELFPDERRPAEHAVSAALRSLSVPGKETVSVRGTAGGDVFNGYNLRIGDVVAHAVMLQVIAEEEEFLSLFK